MEKPIFFYRAFFMSIALILFTYPAVLADYTQDVQRGNAAFKARDWHAAVIYFKQAYSQKQDPAVKKALDYCISEEYQELTGKGNAAYKSGNKAEAMKYYRAAYGVSPNPGLEKFMETMAGPANTRPQHPHDQTAKLVLLGVDTALVIGTVVTWMSESKAADDYSKLYSSIDNTTPENYNMLLSKYVDAKGKQDTFSAVAAVTGVMAAYTLTDMFALHFVFAGDGPVKAAGIPGGAMLALNERF